MIFQTHTISQNPSLLVSAGVQTCRGVWACGGVRVCVTLKTKSVYVQLQISVCFVLSGAPYVTRKFVFTPKKKKKAHPYAC